MWRVSEGGRARNIADLTGRGGIAPEHVTSAIQYRSLHRTPGR